MDDSQEKAGRGFLKPVQGGSPSRVILVGARRDARRVLQHLDHSQNQELSIVGFVDAAHDQTARPRPRGRHLPVHAHSEPVPVLGGIDRLGELVKRARATHVVVAVSMKPRRHVRPRMAQLTNSHVAVHWVSVEKDRLDIDALQLDPKPGGRTSIGQDATWALPSLWHRNHSRLGRLAKRSVDFTGALLGLLLLSPLFALVSAAILLGSGRPIFYTQARRGQGGRLFRIIKFRSMRCDAESVTGPIWASDHDARCTRIGDWLRHTNIDELPQLFNVLKGEMSLVGPRPERPMFVDQFSQEMPDYDLRHAVPGGMTGWAQVHGWRGRTSLRKRIQYDLDYIQRWSFGLDFRILFMTIQHVVWGKTSWNLSRPTRKPEP
jgi:undecaprenyl-phosphate glucose phosphotransferase